MHAQPPVIREFTFGQSSAAGIPARRKTYAIALVVHVLLFVVLAFGVRHRVLRVGQGPESTGIAAYVPGPIGTTGTTSQAAAQPKKPAPARAARSKPAEEQPGDDAQAGGGAGAQGTGVGSGPVRLGTGGDLTLLKRVQPAYPSGLQRMRIPGTVVLDAIIHRDGTIGDITILRSSHGEFAQAAVAAVKQWRYTPIPYEGIVTVTVNFTIPS